MRNSFFIVIEGIDGSGKTEIVKMLHNYLFSKNKKYRIMTTREPTSGTYGKLAREILRNEKNPMSSSKKIAELFIKDRKEHLKNTIEPFLKNKRVGELNIVICDRYYYSTIAFQGAQGIDIDGIIEKNRGFRKPDIAFILDVKPSIALQRISYREKEKFEQMEFMEKIRNNFLKLPNLLPDNMRIIDSSRPLKKVFEEIKKITDNAITES